MAVPAEQMTVEDTLRKEADPDIPNTTPRTFLGQPVQPASTLYYGGVPLGFFDSVALSAEASAKEGMQRWSALIGGWDTDQIVPIAKQKEMIGDRDIPLDRTYTLPELERKITTYDRNQYVEQFNANGFGSFIGTLIGSTLDPVNIATLPVGGANISRAVLSRTIGQVLKESAVGSTKAAIATAGAEAFVQQQAEGGADIQEVAASALGTFVLSNALTVVPSYARIALGRNPDPAAVDALEQSALGRNVPDTDPNSIAKLSQDEQFKALPPPPEPTATEVPAVPETLINSDFRDYTGGARQFFRDLAARRPKAWAKARDLDIDPEDQALQKAIRSIGDASDLRSMTPPEYNENLLGAMARLDTKESTRTEKTMLRQNGILTADFQVRDLYEEVVQAAKTAPDQRTPEQQEAVEDFIFGGASGRRNEARRNLHEQLQPVLDEMNELRRNRPQAPKNSKRMKEYNRKVDSLRKRALGLRIKLSNLSEGPRVIDDGVSDEYLFSVLQQARQTTRNPETASPVMEFPIVQTEEAVRTEAMALAEQSPVRSEPPLDGETAELVAWATDVADSHGANAAEVKEELSEVMQVIERARNAALSCRT